MKIRPRGEVTTHACMVAPKRLLRHRLPSLIPDPRNPCHTRDAALAGRTQCPLSPTYRREVHGLHNVLVDERVQLVPGDRVPHLRCEITTTSCRPRRGNVQLGGPHGPLMPREGPDPVPRVAAPQHRLGVKASADEEDAIRRLAAVVQLRERAVMAGANDGARHRVRRQREAGRRSTLRGGEEGGRECGNEEQTGREWEKGVRDKARRKGDQEGDAVNGSWCVDTSNGGIDGNEANT